MVLPHFAMRRVPRSAGPTLAVGLVTRTTPLGERQTVKLMARGMWKKKSSKDTGHNDKRQVSGSRETTMRTIREHLACGAIGRLAQSTSMYPIDTIKTRVQVSRAIESSFRGPMGRVQAAISMGHLYRGLPFALVGNVPYGMIAFGVYETFKTEVFEKRYPQVPKTVAVVLSACLGDFLGAFALTPAEVVKSKTQAGLYASSMEATSAIFKRSGITGFYQGHIAALCRDVPFRAVQLTLYEHARHRYSKWLARRYGREMGALENLTMGAVIGMATAATTTPLDVVRTRMMSQSPGSGAAYGNALDCMAKTVRTEGFLALYKGIGPRLLLIGPSAAVFFVAYEASKKFFRARASKIVACNITQRRRPAHARTSFIS